jgi:hypothetical protein
MKTNVFWFYLLASISGIISMVLQHFFIPDLKQYDSPLFPLIRTGIEGISFWVLAYYFKRFWCQIIKQFIRLENRFNNNGAFPILAIFEMFVDSSSHNMFPFEFIFLCCIFYSCNNWSLHCTRIKKGFSQINLLLRGQFGLEVKKSLKA